MGIQQERFPISLQKQYAAFLAAQDALENAYLLSLSVEESSIERFGHIDEALNMLYHSVQGLGAFAHKSSYIQEETFRIAYQFCIHIVYLEEQIPQLLELIKTFYAVYYSTPKRAKKIGREIVYNLETIIHSSREVPGTLAILLKQPHLSGENKHHLRLIYSSAN